MRLNLLNMLFPNVCPFCDQIINFDNDTGFCCSCANKISPVTNTRFIPISDNSYVTCISSFEYKGAVRDAIHRFKFKGKRNYRFMFGRSLFKTFMKYNHDNIKPFDVVTFVPFSKKQKRSRNYNQSYLLAKSFAQNLSLPCKPLLLKTRDNKVQHELNASQRSQNVKGVYKVSKISSVSGKNIILCDDIVTTGCTLKENVNQLLAANAKSVICLTLADARISYDERSCF